MDLEGSIGLQVDGLGVIGGEQDKGGVERYGVAGIRQG